MARGQPQGRELREGKAWRYQVKVWSTAVVCLSFLSACFIVRRCVTHNSLSNQSAKRLTDHPEYERLTCRTERKGLRGKGWACCPEKWLVSNTSCYCISSGKETWNESLKTCSGMGAHLLVVNTKEEQNFISKYLRKTSAYYVGLSDPEGKRRWQWVDGSRYNKNTTLWLPGEPNDPDERCVVIYSRGGDWGWKDCQCAQTKYSICEMKKIYL